MKLVKFSKFLILVALCLGFGIKSSLVKGLDINYREDSAANSNFAQLHNVAILGEKDLGLKFDDVFRKILREIVWRGRRFEPTGVLKCWSDNLNRWKKTTAFLVKNKKGELRLISTRHGMIDGESRLAREALNPDTNTDCVFMLTRDFMRALEHCPGGSSRRMSCERRSGWVHDISRDRNFTKPIKNPPEIKTDLAVLKFKGPGPDVSHVFKLRKLKSTDNFSVEHGSSRNTFTKRPGQARYTGTILSPSLGFMSKASCAVYPRKKDQIVMNDNVMITDCHTIGGFSGSPLVFTNQETGEREVSCVISSGTFRLKKKGYAFDERKSVNLCQAITDEVLDLLER